MPKPSYSQFNPPPPRPYNEYMKPYMYKNPTKGVDFMLIDDIVGTAEVAAILECPKQQIHTLRKRPDFPKPIVILAATPIWKASDIKTWKKTWKRRKG
jgi:predicted DNA-binding transcriptional regulator AlpA